MHKQNLNHIWDIFNYKMFVICIKSTFASSYSWVNDSNNNSLWVD
jgi:hypothetical protein